MPKNNKKKKGAKQSNWGSIKLGGFQASFPQPRLPRLLGTPNLAAKNSVYPYLRLDFPINPVSISLVAGAVSAFVAIGTNLMTNWSNVEAVFREFCIVGARFEIRPIVVTAGQGLLIVAVDDAQAASAVGVTTLSLPHIEVPIPATLIGNPRVQRVDWKAHDYVDLDYVPTSSSGAIASLQAYAAAATTFTAAGTACTFAVTGSIAVCLRGYNT